MGCHPCCGGSLQTWTKVIAVVQIIRSTLALVGGVILLTCGGIVTASAAMLANVTAAEKGHGHGQGQDLIPANHHHFTLEETTTTVALSNNGTTTSHPDTGPEFYTFVGIVLIMASIFYILEGTVTMILSILLYSGASNRIAHKCRIWLVVQCVLMLPGVVFFFAGLSDTSSIDAYNTNLGTGIGLAINSYCIWVVHEFIKELRVEQESRRLGLGQAIYGQKMPMKA